RFRRFGVVFHRADTTTERDTDHHGHFHPALGAIVQFRELGHDLIETGEDEPVELDLTHGTVAAHGKSDRGADDAGLGQRGVQHTVFSEVLLQAVGDAEDTAEGADVLTHHQHFG